MHNRVRNAQVSDTTGDNSSNGGWDKKFIPNTRESIKYLKAFNVLQKKLCL